MANTTVTNLPTVTALNGSEPLLGVQAGSSVQITTGQIASLAVGNGGLPFAVSVGGTGDSSFIANEILIGNGTSPLQTISGPAGTDYVLVASSGSAPTWQPTVPTTAAVTSLDFGTTGLLPNVVTTGDILVTGTLVAANGGTGQSSYTVGDLLYASGATALSKLADVAVGAVLVSGGVGVAPAWSASPTLTSLTIPTIYGGTGAASSLTLQSTSGAGTTDSIIFKVGNAGATTALTIGTGTSANFTFGGTAQRFIADFDNATINSRFAFRTSTLNASTGIYALPNGAGTAASWQAANSSDLTNASKILIATNGSTDVQLVSGRNGTGTYLPLSIYTGGSQVAQVGTTGNWGFGGNATAFIGLAVPLSITGATSAYGQRINGNVQSDVTTLAAAYFSNIALANASFTTTDLVHFLASPPTGGAGSTATNQYGFKANSTLGSSGAATVTNSYGFYSDLASASNKWNFFANGTANNAFAGNVRIGSVVAPTTALDVTGTTTSNYFIANGATTGSRTQGAYAYGTLGFSDQNILASFQSSVNTYNQLLIQNTSSGVNASTAVVIGNDLSTASTYYGEFGMNSSGFSGTGSLNAVNAIYLTATSADLVLGTTTANGIKFVVNSGTTDAMSISSAGAVNVASSMTATTVTATAGAGFQNMVVQTSGTSWSLPAALQVTGAKFKVTIVGGGAGGAGCAAAATFGGGGGGGAVVVVYYTYVAGQNTLTYTVGGTANGGTGAAAGTAGNASSATYNSLTSTAGGGSGGAAAGAGGAGGTGSGTAGTLTIVGQAGGAGGTTTITAGQTSLNNSGGSSGLGFGYGGLLTFASGGGAGTGGQAYGGGGSGAMGGNAATSRNGGAGSAGAVIIEY